MLLVSALNFLAFLNICYILSSILTITPILGPTALVAVRSPESGLRLLPSFVC